MIRLAPSVAVLVCSTAILTGRVEGQQLPAFSVVSRVFAEQEPQSFVEHLIAFRDGKAYDLPKKPASQSRFVTIFDPQNRKITLLDEQSKVCSAVATERLLEVTAKARLITDDPVKREHLGLLCEPQRTRSGELTVHYSKASYVTSTTRPTNPDAAAQFGQFSDWALRLNIARRVDAPPPFARMKLNQALSRTGEVPDLLKITFRREPQPQRYRVSHEWHWDLTPELRSRLEEIDDSVERYRQVSLERFPSDT